MAIEVNVTPHKVTITNQDEMNQGEYNINTCNFTFSSEYDNLEKRAVFSNITGQKYLVKIENNMCIVPEEILSLSGSITLGVYAYTNQNNRLHLRYSPSPVNLAIGEGSYIPNTPVPPSKIEDLYIEIEEFMDSIQQQIADGDFDGVGISSIVFNPDYTLTITLTDNTSTTSQSLRGEVGETGAKGEDGYTPIKGVDYFTDEEVSEIESDVIDRITPNIPTKTSDIINDSGFINNTVNNLINYTLKTNTGSLIDLEINGTTYVITLNLKDIDGNIISTDTIDLPLESVVVSGRYDNNTKKVILTLENGSEVDFSVADLVAGLQTEITSNNKLASDLVDDTNSGNKFTNISEKNGWNAKYDKPNGGIPKTDLANDVQSSLDKADSAIQTHQDITGKEDKSNKVTSLDSNSTDTQYPSAKCVYDGLTEKVDKSSFVYDSITETLTITI